MASLKHIRINKMIAAEVPHIELERGEGYHYLIFDDGKHYETRSIMVPYLRDLSPSEWVQEAVDYRKELL